MEKYVQIGQLVVQYEGLPYDWPTLLDIYIPHPHFL